MKPFIRWAGGKTALLPTILPLIQRAIADRGLARYYEPFLGGGAVALALLDQPINPKLTFYLSDSNDALVRAWGAYSNFARDRLNFLLKSLDDLAPDERYKEVREVFNWYRLHRRDRSSTQNPTVCSTGLCSEDIAGLFLWLNRNCYNGLWRENRKGEFNVPWGRKEKQVDWDYYEQVMVRMWDGPSTVWLDTKSYQKLSTDHIHHPTSFIYYDPPYDRESPTGFTRYTASDFGRDQAELLAQQFEQFHQKGATLLQSNANTEWIRKRYAAFNIQEVEAPRRISRNGKGRQPVTELLISNF